MQVVLVMFRSDGERRSFSVVRNMTVIGRREDCDLRIPVGDVSRKHCRLVRTDDGIRIEDLGSSNGTYVNGTRVQESELSAGDTVGVGPVQFIVQIDGVPEEQEMVAPIANPLAEPASAEEADFLTEEEPSVAPVLDEAELEELPAEEEFQLEEAAHTEAESPVMDLEEAPLEEVSLEEVSLEEEPLEEEPLDDKPIQDDLLVEESVHEDSAEEHSIEEVSPRMVPAEELTLEEQPLEEDATHSGKPLESEAPSAAPTEAGHAVAESPLIDDELDDFALEELPEGELPVEEIGTAPAAAPIAHPETVMDAELDGEVDDEFGEFELELLDGAPSIAPATAPAPGAATGAAVPPVDSEALDEFELAENSLLEEPVAPSANHLATAADLLEPTAATDDSELEDMPVMPVSSAAPAGEVPLDDDFDFDADLEPVADAPVSPESAAAAASESDDLDELEFTEEIETHLPAAAAPVEQPKRPATEPLSLAPTAPEFSEVDMDSIDESIEPVSLEDETAEHGEHAPTESDSAWDFLIEEPETPANHDDLKIDLDSPHQQPHG